MDRAIWWIRRDLRLADNQALTEALRQAREVVPLFILDPKLVNSRNNSEKRLSFLYYGLRKLDADLRKLGSRLVVRRGNPAETLTRLNEDYNISRIFAEADFSPYARKRDARVAAMLPLELVGSPGLRHPDAVVKENGAAYTVYTPYMRAWKKHGIPGRRELLPTPERIVTPDVIYGEPFPEPLIASGETQFQPGEKEANLRLERFIENKRGSIFGYGDLRNRMDIDGTSGLSPYLRFGMISARQAVAAANEAIQLAAGPEGESSAQTWMNELVWREFYISILYHFPDVAKQSFRPELREMQWKDDSDDFNAWIGGATGYPVVDAGMRQLNTIGWMHNRARMITASFLVKDLLIDWRLGEAYFMRHLVDGDPAANNGGWQWTAGTGTDAAPYFRIFNPILQGQKFDPDGTYIH
jgi:deoxyribodipyrimidine photo-lyase